MIGLGMQFAHGWVAELSQVATGSLVSAVWQGVLLAAAAALGLRLLPKTPAAVRFAIWFGVFLLVAALPVRAASAAGGHGAWITLDGRWCLAIAAVWATASMVRAATLVAAGFRVRALWKRARPVELEGAEFVHPTHGDEAAMNGAPKRGRKAQICTSDEVDRPTVIGFFSPKILIPEWLLKVLSPAELEQIVLHESGHLGRADDWMNLLQKIALVVFPLNPALAWVERRLCFERELAVDERVLQATGAPKAYAACLATLAEHRLRQRGLALVLGALGRDSELGRRVTRILERGERMKPLQARLVLGGAVVALLVAATGLARCPQVVGFDGAGNPGTSVEQATATAGPICGYRAQAVLLRMNLPASQEWKPLGDAAVAMQKPQIQSAIRHIPEVKVERRNDADKAVDVAAKGLIDSADAAARTIQMATNSETSPDGSLVVTRYTVVTSLQDGSRVVLTTAQVVKSAPRVQQDVQDDQGPAEQEAPRYAAVPVRGGWLVFQL